MTERYTYLVWHLLERAAERTPDAEAVRFNGEALTYAELATRSNQVAHVLIDEGVRRGDRVGLFMSRGLEAITAVYGIMKAGAAYVPLDVAAPPARLAFTARDCGIRVVFANADRRVPLARMLEHEPGIELVVGLQDGAVAARCASWDSLATAQSSLPSCSTIEQDLAYVLYTSGTTGEPKGMMHTHRSSLSFVQWAADKFSFCADDRVSNYGPFHFDLSTFDYFASALAGATTVIVPEPFTKLPASFSKLVDDEQISVVYAVPFAWMQLLERGAIDQRDLQSLRLICFAGEAFGTRHLRALMERLPKAAYCNLYGVTEINVCTYYPVPMPLPNDDPLPVGRLCETMQARVVDEADEDVDTGEVGELLVRTPTMMTGYVGRPELDAQVFAPHTGSAGQPQVYFRTGDLVRLGVDGYYSFVGRKDRQIKTRGVRVELDEVELALAAHVGVGEAVAWSVPDGRGSVEIHAVARRDPGAEFTEAELLDTAKARLPKYALPVRLRIVDTLPRTSTGKIDRRKVSTQEAST